VPRRLEECAEAKALKEAHQRVHLARLAVLRKIRYHDCAHGLLRTSVSWYFGVSAIVCIRSNLRLFLLFALCCRSFSIFQDIDRLHCILLEGGGSPAIVKDAGSVFQRGSSSWFSSWVSPAIFAIRLFLVLADHPIPAIGGIHTGILLCFLALDVVNRLSCSAFVGRCRGAATQAESERGDMPRAPGHAMRYAAATRAGTAAQQRDKRQHVAGRSPPHRGKKEPLQLAAYRVVGRDRDTPDQNGP